MEINVSHLLKSAVGTTREYDFDSDETLLLDDDYSADITDGHVRLDRMNTGILARGQVNAVVQMACARCLEPVKERLTVDFAEEFEPSIDVTTGKPLPAPENELAFSIGPQHVLDLSEALRQNIVASLPLQPLCREDCAGLCPSCGTNRNVATCECIVDDANHPFAALVDLLRDSG